MMCPNCASANIGVLRGHRNCHYSAFAGGRRTPSRYSLLVCLGTRTCAKAWRSKAKGVARLPTITHDAWEAFLWEGIKH